MYQQVQACLFSARQTHILPACWAEASQNVGKMISKAVRQVKILPATWRPQSEEFRLVWQFNHATIRGKHFSYPISKYWWLRTSEVLVASLFCCQVSSGPWQELQSSAKEGECLGANLLETGSAALLLLLFLTIQHQRSETRIAATVQ